MRLYSLLVNGKKNYQKNDSLNSIEPSSSFGEIVEAVKKGQNYLRQIGVDDIIGILDQLSNKWADRDNPLQKKYPKLGINYLVYYFKKSNLKSICDLSLRGNRHNLDDYTSISSHPFKLLAQPRGIICHWLSGNIPILGLLSAVGGLLTKNANIIKISKQTNFLIPDLLESLNRVKYKNSKGKLIEGRKILESIAVIFFDKDDGQAQTEFSLNANVRIAWGGKDAVESIINLPRRWDTEDVVFGPRTSFVVVGKEFLDNEGHAKETAKKIALDVSLYEQRGCNSPHTVFIEKGGKISPIKFANILANSLDNASKIYPLENIETADTQKIILERAKYDMIGLAMYPSDLQWTLLYSENDEGIAIPCFNRTLYVRVVKSIFEIEKYCSSLTQSAGTALSPDRKEKFSKLVTAKGVDRIPDVGNMLFYDTPWDGMFMMDRLVRWSKL